VWPSYSFVYTRILHNLITMTQSIQKHLLQQEINHAMLFIPVQLSYFYHS
jgi:hypothetical protein